MQTIIWIALAANALLAPAVTSYWITKKILFPRGIQSKFAKEQQRKEALRKANELLQQQAIERERLFKEAQAILVDWAPGAIVAGPPNVEREPSSALAWLAAADLFDAAADRVRQDTGKVWTARTTGDY